MAITIDLDALKTPLGEDDEAAGPDPDDAPDAVQDTIRAIRGIASEALELERTNPAVAGLNEDKASLMRKARDKWQEVVKQGLPFLAQSAKDLQVCANVTRGLARLEGPAGLVQGLEIFQIILETFWDTCWPRPDGDDWEERVEFLLQVTSEDDDLVRALRRWPLTPSNENHTLEAYEKDQSLHGEMAGAAGVAAAYGQDLADAAHRATELLEALTVKIREGTDYNEELDTALLRSQVVEPLARTVRVLYQTTDAAPQDGSPVEDAAADTGTPSASLAAPAAGFGPGTVAASGAAPAALSLTREDCLVILQRIGDFFVRTEPQAPLGSQLHDLVRRARLSFDELLTESIPDYDTRSDVYLRMGVKPPPEPEGE